MRHNLVFWCMILILTVTFLIRVTHIYGQGVSSPLCGTSWGRFLVSSNNSRFKAPEYGAFFTGEPTTKLSRLYTGCLATSHGWQHSRNLPCRMISINAQQGGNSCNLYFWFSYLFCSSKGSKGTSRWRGGKKPSLASLSSPAKQQSTHLD